MNIALLNQRITIQENAVVSDAIGNRKNEWRDYFSCCASISDSQGKSSGENAVAGQIVDTSDISFTVRYCTETATVTNTSYRILWNGEVYNIVKVDHMNMKKHSLKFKCEKVRR